MNRLSTLACNAGTGGVIRSLFVAVAVLILSTANSELIKLTWPPLGVLIVAVYLMRNVLVSHFTMTRWAMNIVAAGGIGFAFCVPYLDIMKQDSPVPMALILIVAGTHIATYFLLLSDNRPR